LKVAAEDREESAEVEQGSEEIGQLRPDADIIWSGKE
jgi:hypothetical protein